MYTQKMINELLNTTGLNYLCIVGYDSGEVYTDVMIKSSNKLPDEGYLEFIMDLYKPLEIRGLNRDRIWVDCFDKIGSINLPHLIANDEVRYTNLLSNMSAN